MQREGDERGVVLIRVRTESPSFHPNTHRYGAFFNEIQTRHDHIQEIQQLLLGQTGRLNNAFLVFEQFDK